MAIKFSNGMYRTTRQQFGLGSLISLCFSGVLFVLIGLFFYNTNKIDPAWTRVEGSVVGATQTLNRSSQSTSNSSIIYTPIVEYRVDNQKYKVTANNGTSNPPSVGAQYPVAYSPANPTDAKVVNSKNVNLIPLVLPAIGIFMIISGLVVYISNQRKRVV